MMCAVRGEPSTTRGQELSDNLLFDERALTEFSGEAGVFNLMHEFHLSMPEVLELCDHLPVWASFRVLEGAADGAIATSPAAPAAR